MIYVYITLALGVCYWLYCLIFRPHECRHKRRIVIQQFRDGCPYVKTICEDCDYRDEGPVHCERSDWKESMKHVRDEGYGR